MEVSDTENERRIIATHNELMRYVERILIFLSTATIAILGFANLNASAGLWVVSAFCTLFFSLGFWFLYSRYQMDISFYALEREDIRSNREEGITGAAEQQREFQAVNKLIHFLQTYSDIVVALLLIFVFGSFFLLLAGLVDQFYEAPLIPIAPSPSVIFAVGAFMLFSAVVWIFLFLKLDKDIDDFLGDEESIKAAA